MANIPNKAVKKIKNDAHREIAAGILIAYGLFPRTNEGIAAAQRLIAGRETWLAPSDLPNYYDNIESDLMTGKETAGIVNIRMLLKEFYGLEDKPTSITLPKLNTGKTTVYKPEDKLVDDITEEFDKKLEETSNDILDVVDALIEKQKKDFEDFKRRQEEERKQKQQGENQYPAPIGPDPIQGPVEPPVQGPKAPPKKTVAPERDEDWEGEVPDQLGTKLDELIDQVKNDPLPQPSTKRRKTKGKRNVKTRTKFDAREMGLGGSLNEILENVIETREALFNLYKLNKERFEFKKNVDQRLTQLLQSKTRESQLEKPQSGEDEQGDVKDKKEKEEKPSVIEKGLLNGLVVALGSMLLPLVIEGIRPLFGGRPEDDTEDEKTKAESEIAEEKAKEEESRGLEEPAEPEPVAPDQPDAVAPEPQAPSPTLPLRDTSAPGDYDYREPSLAPNAQIPMRAAAKGGKFKKGKHEKLKPVSGSDLKETKVDKLTKVIPDIISLPQKAAAVGMITLANSVISPFSPFIPKEGREFINNIYRETSDMAGLKGLDIRLKEEESIFDKLKKAFDDIFGNMFGGGGGDGPGRTGPSGPPGGAGTSATADEEDLLKRLMIAEAGGEGELGMAAVARAVINRSGLVQSGKVNAGQFMAASGSISDIIKAPKQFSPYAQGKLERQLTPEEDARATKALAIVRNQADHRGRLEAAGSDSTVINTIMAATGFRNYDAGAGIDRSQQVNEQQFGRHTFNTAGNAGMLYMPYMGTTAPPAPPEPPAPPPSNPPPGPTPRPDRRASAAAAARARGQSQESSPEIKPPDATSSVSSPAPKQPSP